MERPTIVAEPGRRPWLIDAAERCILANYAHWGLFQRGDMLVRVTNLSAEEVEREKRIRRPAGAIILRRVTAPMIEDTFGRAVHWINTKSFDIDCPPKIAAIYLSREGMWRLPHLTGIIEAPVMCPDGTIVMNSGYDEATGLLLESRIAWPALPAPSRAAAEAAVRCLTEPFVEFPFSTPAGWSVLVSAVLSGLQRRLLPSAPAHAFDAPLQGSGKSLLGDCVSLLVTGHRIASMSFNPNEEEFRKKLMAGLIAGDAIFEVDNITKPLRSDALASILTLEMYKDRILGVTENKSVPTNGLFLLTGNNLQFSGDMPSRVISARIEPNCERPEEREFKIGDLRAHVLGRRPQLITAALTIMQSYFFAGRPSQHLKAFGRFEKWSDEIRSALVWAGLPDPCLSRDEVIATDPERDAALAVFENWFRAIADERVTLQELLECANTNANLKSALLGVAVDIKHTDTVSSGRLGAWFRARAGRIVGDYKFVRAGEVHAGFKTWQVLRLDAQAHTTEEI